MGVCRGPDSRSDWNLASEEGDDSNKALRGRVVCKAGCVNAGVCSGCFGPAELGEAIVVAFFEAARL